MVRIEQLLEHHDEVDVAERLNAEGLLTGAGGPFDANAVRWVRYTHGLATPQERLRETGKLTVREAADRLGVIEETVRQWARDGRLAAERTGRKPIWLIEPLEEQSEDVRELAARTTQRQTPKPSPAVSTPLELRERIDELILDGHTDAYPHLQHESDQTRQHPEFEGRAPK